MHGFSLDHICLKGNQLFFYGWGFHKQLDVCALTFRFSDKKDALHETDVEYGRAREDVKAAYPDLEQSLNSGFLLLVGLDERPKNAFLDWYFSDGSKVSYEVPLPVEPALDKYNKNINYYIINIIRLLVILRKSGLRTTITKLKKYLSKRPVSIRDDSWKEMKSIIAGQKLIIILDHDMGGGANIYRKKIIEDETKSGCIVVLLSYHVASLEYFLQVYSLELESERYQIDNIYDLFDLIQFGHVKYALYNCAVTFRDPLEIPELLISIKKITLCDLIVAVHDYFIVCPSNFLLNNKKVFCNVPDVSSCNNCLQLHKDSFVSLTGCRDIGVWRAAWGRLIDAATQVRVFSNSTMILLDRAYKESPKHKWDLIPHSLVTNYEPIKLNGGRSLHIGVVGSIGWHKGAKVISDLSKYIKENQLDVKVTVIGTLDEKYEASVVNVTGPYSEESLPKLILNNNINVFLFPSICPETFSYVANELVSLNVPMACFDLGAPADLVRQYTKGLILKSMDSENILKQLMEFRQRIYNL